VLKVESQSVQCSEFRIEYGIVTITSQRRAKSSQSPVRVQDSASSIQEGMQQTEANHLV
jgi:hypothetical protein